MDLVASSTMVRKYLKPSWVSLANGPQTSQWIKSKALFEIWVKDGNGSLFYFAIGQRTQFLLLWKDCTSGI